MVYASYHTCFPIRDYRRVYSISERTNVSLDELVRPILHRCACEIFGEVLDAGHRAAGRIGVYRRQL